MVVQTAVRQMRGRGTDDPRIDGPSTDDTLRAMTQLLKEARPVMVVSGVAIAAVTAGVAVEEVILPTSVHAGVGAVLYVGFLAVVVACVVRVVSLMISASSRLMDELGELRRQTGAPVDSRVPWTPVRNVGIMSPALRRSRMEAVISAAHFRNLRVHQALGWAAISVIAFFAWTFVSLIMAGRI